METIKDSNVSEVAMQPHASNERKFNHKEGEGQMETTANTQRAETISDLVSQFGNSHLRMARYQCMKDYLNALKRIDFPQDLLEEFPAWLPGEKEQALEDVIRCGDGEVVCVDIDGTIVIDVIGRDSKGKGGQHEKK